MKKPLQPDLFKMKSFLRPVGDFCTGFKWVNGGFGPKTESIGFNDWPTSEGRVCSRLEDSASIIYELAWGKYSEIGSVRATFIHWK